MHRNPQEEAYDLHIKSREVMSGLRRNPQEDAYACEPTVLVTQPQNQHWLRAAFVEQNQFINESQLLPQTYYLKQALQVNDTSHHAMARYRRARANNIQRHNDELICSVKSGKDCIWHGYPALIDSCAGLVQLPPEAAEALTDGLFAFKQEILLAGVVPAATQKVRFGAELNSVAIMIHDLNGKGEPKIRMWIDSRNQEKAQSCLGASLVFRGAQLLLPSMSIDEMASDNNALHVDGTHMNSTDGITGKEYYCKVKLAAGDYGYAKLTQHSDMCKPVLILYNPRHCSEDDIHVPLLASRPTVKQLDTQAHRARIPAPPSDIERLPISVLTAQPLQPCKSCKPKPTKSRSTASSGEANYIQSSLDEVLTSLDTSTFSLLQQQYESTICTSSSNHSINSTYDSSTSTTCETQRSARLPDVLTGSERLAATERHHTGECYLFPADIDPENLHYEHLLYTLQQEVSTEQLCEINQAAAVMQAAITATSTEMYFSAAQLDPPIDLLTAHRSAGHLGAKH